uniref:Uncharacterized protein n=1 Tax=Anguilla anguilla TaxID=7936 RepID=A0A0E9QAB0_ANGAN
MPYLQTGKLLFNRKSTTSVLWSVINLILKWASQFVLPSQKIAKMCIE